MELVGPGIASVVEDDEKESGSRVDLCVELVIEPLLPIDRAVVVILDTEDVTTGNEDIYKSGKIIS